MDKTNSLTQVIQQSQRVFKGIRFDVYATDLPGSKGQTVHREFIAHPGAVVILPLLNKDTVVMIRNERFAVGQQLWELPAGTLEPHELPEKTAYRELIEETGYRADNLQPLTQFFTSPGICNELMHAYVAKDLEFVGQQLDESEQIIVETLSWNKIKQMIRHQEILDGKTLTTLLYYLSENRHFA